MKAHCILQLIYHYRGSLFVPTASLDMIKNKFLPLAGIEFQLHRL